MQRLLILLFVALFSISAVAKTARITVGFIERPPTIFKNADGSLRGELGRKLTAVFDKASIRADFLPTQPVDIDSYVTREDQDALIVTRTLVKQTDNYLFSDKPLISLKFYAYHKSSTPSVSSMSELKNKSVVIPIAMENIRGPLQAALSDSTKQIRVVAEEGRLSPQLEYIRRDQAEYAISYFSPSNVAMMFSSRVNQRSIVASEVIAVPMHFVIKKSVNDARQIMDAINQAMAE